MVTLSPASQAAPLSPAPHGRSVGRGLGFESCAYYLSKSASPHLSCPLWEAGPILPDPGKGKALRERQGISADVDEVQ